MASMGWLGDSPRYSGCTTMRLEYFAAMALAKPGCVADLITIREDEQAAMAASTAEQSNCAPFQGVGTAKNTMSHSDKGSWYCSMLMSCMAALGNNKWVARPTQP